MIRRLGFVFISIAVILCLTIATSGQRSTGNIQGTVTDPGGIGVPGVEVTIKGVSVGFFRVVQTNSAGFYSIQQIPQGTYEITASLTGRLGPSTFRAVVAVEKTTTADVTIGPSAKIFGDSEIAGNSLGMAIDTRDSKVQTILPSALTKRLPTGTSFDSLLTISPSTSQEPLSGGFQIYGASGSENAFIVDGLQLENFRTGILDPAFNIPISLISEIQIKTGGFLAEHVGASGGVISVATETGTDILKGEFGTSFEPSRLQAGPRFAPQRFVASSSSQAAINANPDFLFAIRQPRDSFLATNPNAKLSGPIVKHHLWFLASFAPKISETSRISQFYNPISNSNFSTGTLVLTPRATQLDPISYNVKTTQNSAFARIDFSVFKTLTGTVSFMWNPIVTEGFLPFDAVSTSNPVNTALGGVSYPSGEYAKLQGGRTNANSFVSSLQWNHNDTLIINAGFVRSFLNDKGGNYALANETRFVCAGSSAAYLTIATGCPGGSGFSNVASNSITTRDVAVRNEFNFDVEYKVLRFGGTHKFKGGYQRGRITNDVQNGNAGTGTITLFYGQDYNQAALPVNLPCSLGAPSCLGVGTLTRSGLNGVGRNLYQGIFFQDEWNPFPRLTLNLGVRSESENLPSYDAGKIIAGAPIPEIRQGFRRKTVPLLGVAYDVFGDGKTKLSAGYGWFYDRMKFELPRNAFGGDFFRTDYFPITAANPNYSFYTTSRILGGFSDPIGGGNPSIVGGLSQLQRDFRIPANLTNLQFTSLGSMAAGVDPDLRSFRQTDIAVGFEKEVFKKHILTARYTHKNVAHVIEDHAILGLGESENRPIGNPGEGLDLQLDRANGTARSAKPKRVYNGIEFVLSNPPPERTPYFYSFTYTLSRLYGNYSGLASSDESGRTAPNVERFFNYPINGYTATGSPDDGDLATDRRHTFKAFGSYTLNWWGGKSHSTTFSFRQNILQGTPQTTFITVVSTMVPLSKRGDLGRAHTLWQTDLGISHKHLFGTENRYAVKFDLTATNAFNNNAVLTLNTIRYRTSNTITATDIDPLYNSSTQTLIPVMNRVLNGQIGTQISQLESGGLASLSGRTNPHSSLYGLPSRYQAQRNVRFGFRFIF